MRKLLLISFVVTSGYLDVVKNNDVDTIEETSEQLISISENILI